MRSRTRSATAAGTASPCATWSKISRWAPPAPSENVQAELDDGPLFAFNGDVLTDVDLTAMSAFHRERGGLATILLTRVDDPRRYGLVEIADDGRVAEFVEKPGAEYAVPAHGALINAGVYLLEPEVLDMIPAGQPAFDRARRVSPARRRRAALRLRGRRLLARHRHARQLPPGAFRPAAEHASPRASSRDVGPSYLFVAPDAVVAPGARVVPPAHVAGGTTLAPGSRVGPLAVVGAGCVIGDGRRDRRVGRAGRRRRSAPGPRSSAASWSAAPLSARTATS